MVDWDKRYSEAAEPLFGDDPNNYVIQTIVRPDFQVTSALCLADGDGRNGRFLARRGIQVTAVELSVSRRVSHGPRTRAAGVRVERVQGRSRGLGAARGTRLGGGLHDLPSL
jgi:hypothetical protein